MIDTKKIDHRVILIKNYRGYRKTDEFRNNGFYYHPVNKDSGIFDIEFVEKRIDLFRNKI
jgi:hypothetical protein